MKGFSLIEVLVAAAIASLGVAAIAETTRAVLLERSRSEWKLRALWAAEQSLEEMIAWAPAMMTPQDLSDTIVIPPWGNVQRRRRVVPGPRDDLWIIAVDVTALRASEVRLETMRRTPWSG